MTTSALVGHRTTLVRQLNLPFWLALAVVVVLYVTAFYLLRLLLPQPEIAGTLAAITLGGGAYVQRAIEQRLSAPPGSIPSLAGYSRPWWVMGGLGIALLAAAVAFVPYAQLAGGPLTAVSGNLDVVIRLVPLATAVTFGVIVGHRSDRYGLAVVIGAALAGYVLGSLLSPIAQQIATGQPTPPGGFGPPPGAPPDPRPLLLGEGLVRFVLENELPLLMAAAMLGFWRGTRTRLSAYVGDLLREAAPDDRTAIVELAYETARSGAAARSAQERVPEPAPGDRHEHQ